MSNEMITLEHVLKAYDYADHHPHKYLRGTTNWCAAVAHALNGELRALLAKPADLEQGKVELERITDAYRAELDELAQRNYDLRFKNSTQPQGEPVTKLTWEEIVGLVNEVLGCKAHKWPLPDVGHEMTGINFNSLARIIDRVQARYTRPAEQPAPDGFEIARHSKRLVEQLRERVAELEKQPAPQPSPAVTPPPSSQPL